MGAIRIALDVLAGRSYVKSLIVEAGNADGGAGPLGLARKPRSASSTMSMTIDAYPFAFSQIPALGPFGQAGDYGGNRPSRP